MNESTSNNPQTPLEEKPSKTRLIWGITIFIIGQLSSFLIPLVTASELSAGWKTALSSLFMLGTPQLGIMIAVAILGKPGYNYVKKQLLRFIRRHGPAEVVSRTRYRIGLVMFLIPILFGFIEPYFGHMIPGYISHPQTFALSGDLLLFASLFVLGGEFWDKLRSLFIYRARANFPVQQGTVGS